MVNRPARHPGAPLPAALRPGPRPLPLHMAVEGWILQVSCSGLLNSSAASPFSNPLLAPLKDRLLKLLPDLAALNPQPLNAGMIDAVALEATARMDTFVRGVRVYQSHPYTRTLKAPPAVWQRGAATLVDYGGKGTPVLYVPSLINKAYILDLAADRSLMRASAASRLHSFLLDWGVPGAAEQAFMVSDYVEGVLIPALEEVKARTGKTPALVGYCMGGTLSVAAAVLRPDLVCALALLAAPWDFHEGTEASRVLLTLSQPMIETILAAEGMVSIDILQAFFASLDPTLVGRKFRRFAELDPASEPARRFVELEDWLNDGVALAGPVAREVFFDWYGRNHPPAGRLRVGETVIDPAGIKVPTFAFIPSQDRIVPPGAAQALARAIPGAEARTVDLGHIGMVSAGSAPEAVYAPLLAWLHNFARA